MFSAVKDRKIPKQASSSLQCLKASDVKLGKVVGWNQLGRETPG
jgi:hypothetical protein